MRRQLVKESDGEDGDQKGKLSIELGFFKLIFKHFSFIKM